jgi:hypothetical protein
MDRTDSTLLAIAAGLILVVVVSFPNTRVVPEMTKALCEDSDGVWNECGSLCTGEPPGIMCIALCVPLCECKSNINCPPGYYCKKSGAAEDETGACRPMISDLCDTDEDCPQPRCPGVYSVCREGECVLVNEMGALARCG